ncbi:hypothetical protein CASFOL_000570 [Castilleja foliolosa]|uniref:Uncharacterized protein n=1 Tax=Castilleja foliolosa TaxID=1961234 RepID=A0ABD3ENW2_9LAMI
MLLLPSSKMIRGILLSRHGKKAKKPKWKTRHTSSYISAWENSKKAYFESKLKKIELALASEAIERGSGAVADGARYWQLRRRYGFLLGFSAILAYGVTVGGGVSMVFANLGRGGPFRRSSIDVG